MGISPRLLHGNWDLGYALDIHTIYSVYVGDNESGYPQYDTLRTDLGELLYQIKYKKYYSKIEDVIDLIADFVVKNFKGKVDWVLPVPPTKNRRVQHVEVIAQEIAELLDCKFSNNVLVNNSHDEAKNSSSQRDISKVRIASTKRNILLIDDITNSGDTADVCTNLLKSDPNIEKVYFITLTIRKTSRRS